MSRRRINPGTDRLREPEYVVRNPAIAKSRHKRSAARSTGPSRKPKGRISPKARPAAYVSNLRSILARLAPTELTVIIWSYFDGLSDLDIALRMEVSEEAINRIRQSALDVLRAEVADAQPSST